MEQLELAVLCVLHSIKGIGSRSLWKIKDNFGSYQQFITADARRLYASFLAPGIVEQIITIRKTVDPLEYLEKILARNIRLISLEDRDYPRMLRNIPEPPYILYYIGNTTGMLPNCSTQTGTE